MIDTQLPPIPPPDFDATHASQEGLAPSAPIDPYESTDIALPGDLRLPPAAEESTQEQPTEDDEADETIIPYGSRARSSASMDALPSRHPHTPRPHSQLKLPHKVDPLALELQLDDDDEEDTVFSLPHRRSDGKFTLQAPSQAKAKKEETRDSALPQTFSSSEHLVAPLGPVAALASPYEYFDDDDDDTLFSPPSSRKTQLAPMRPASLPVGDPNPDDDDDDLDAHTMMPLPGQKITRPARPIPTVSDSSVNPHTLMRQLPKDTQPTRQAYGQLEEEEEDEPAHTRNLSKKTITSFPMGGNAAPPSANDYGEKALSDLLEDVPSEPNPYFDNDPSPAPIPHTPGMSDKLIGRQFGNFRLDEKIGTGGFGTVYKATQVFLQQPIAVKVLHVDFQGHTEIQERFRREAQSLAQLRHDNIVQLSDFGLLPGLGFYIAMEFLEGQSLHERFRAEEHFTMERIHFLAKELCRVLDYVHQKGIIHRDIKPSNIILFREDVRGERLKLIDFGIASIQHGNLNAITQVGRNLGTVRFMSPEQMTGESPIDGRSDLYSVATIIYQMLCDRPPYVGNHDAMLMHQKTHTAATLLTEAKPDKQWSPALVQFFQSALSIDPTLRPADAKQFWEQFKVAFSKQMELETGLPSSLPLSMDIEEFGKETYKALDLDATSPEPEDDEEISLSIQKRAKRRFPAWLTYVVVLLLGIAGGVVGVWWFLFHP